MKNFIKKLSRGKMVKSSKISFIIYYFVIKQYTVWLKELKELKELTMFQKRK